MTSIVALSREFRFFFSRDYTRESEIILPLFLSFSFLFSIKIQETFYLSAIINAGLLRDLTLGISYDNNYREEIYTFMQNCVYNFNRFSRGLSFRGLMFRGLRSEVSRSEFSSGIYISENFALNLLYIHVLVLAENLFLFYYLMQNFYLYIFPSQFSYQENEDPVKQKTVERIIKR